MNIDKAYEKASALSLVEEGIVLVVEGFLEYQVFCENEYWDDYEFVRAEFYKGKLINTY